MTKAGNPKYFFSRNDLYEEQLPGCCGVSVVCGFEVWIAAEYQDGSYELGPKLYNQIYREIGKKRICRNVQIALVSKYKGKRGLDKEQIPGFIDWLVTEKKWKKLDRFINPNHGNEVTVLSKTFPKKKEKPNIGYFGRAW